MLQLKTIKEKIVKDNYIQLYQYGSIYVLRINDFCTCYLTMKEGNAAYKKAYMLLSKGLTVEEVEEEIYEVS